MNKFRLKHGFLGLISALVLDASTNAYAFNLQASFQRNGDAFFSGRPVEDAALDTMRGGFVASNGMTINFSFSANTLIDGQLVNQITLNTANLAQSLGSLQNIIQIGDGNSAFNGAPDMSALPNVLSVVQNNLDNLTIQQLNLLDMTVQNMGNYNRHAFVREIDFQNTRILPP